MTASKPISSPGQKMKTPKKGPLTPGLKSKSPSKSLQTPVQKTKTPIKGAQTPAEMVKSPGKGPQTPVQKIKTPCKGSKTPAQNSQTPVQKIKTPSKGSKTPAQNSQTPVQKIKTPSKGPKTPAPNSQTPVQKIKTPSIGSKTPAQNSQTPVQKIKTPSKGSKTPAQNSQTPGLKPKTPIKSPQTPALKKKTPGKCPQTPALKISNANGPLKLSSVKANVSPKPKTPINKSTPKSKTPQAMETEQPEKSSRNGSLKAMTPNASGTSKHKKSINQSIPESEVSMEQSFEAQMSGGQRKRSVRGEIVGQGKNKRAIAAKQEKRIEEPHAQDLSSRTVRIYNLPDAVPQPLLLKKIQSWLAEQCTVEQIQIVPGKTCHIVVTFSTAEDAKTAKKLNGHVIEGRHLSIIHKDDKLVPIENRIVLSEVPSGLTDEDIWRRFGKCGKISSIFMMRQYKTSKVLKCFVAFENEKGALAALAMKNPGMVVTRQNRDSRSYPPESSVFVKGLKKNTSEGDLKKFISNAGPVASVTILGHTSALVEMNKVEDVESALALTGKKLSGNPITVMRHKLSSHNIKPVKEGVPSKKMKSDGSAESMLVKMEDEDSLESTDREDDEDIESSDDMETDSEIDEKLLTDFLGKFNSLKSNKIIAGKDDDEDDNSEDDDEETDEDDDEGTDDEDSEKHGDEGDSDLEDSDEDENEGSDEDDDDIDDDEDGIDDNDDDTDDDDDDIDEGDDDSDV